MVVAIMGAATLAVSAGSAISANKQASKANKNQKNAADQQAQAAQDQLDFSKEQYADWKEMFGPMMGDLRDMAYEEDTPDFGAIHADVRNAVDSNRGINKRDMERVGVKPGEGAMLAAENSYGLGAATMEVGMRNTERARLEDDKFQKIASVYGLGNGQMTGALSGMQAGSAGLQNAYGNQANMFGQQAREYSAAAQAGAQGVGYGLSQMANQWGARNTGGGGGQVPNSPSWGVSSGSQAPWQTPTPAPWQTGYGG